MSHMRVWLVRAVVLALVAAPGIAIMVQHGFAGDSAGKVCSTAALAREESRVTSCELTPGDGIAAPALQEAAQGGESTAACRKEPQCSVDSDCDLLCGVGLGKCVHSSCPVRICKCH